MTENSGGQRILVVDDDKNMRLALRETLIREGYRVDLAEDGSQAASLFKEEDLALIVTEPTVSGVHDLERILGTVNHFRVPALVLINKADLNPVHTARIEAYCLDRGIDLVGKIAYDNVVTEAMVQGQPVTAYQPDGDVATTLRQAWLHIQRHLDGAA